MRRVHLLTASVVALSLGLGVGAAQAALLTFDDAIAGSISYQFDGDGDAIPDVLFSTADPSGFQTIGPGLNQLYIDEPGLEGTTLLPVDLRVDFLSGALGSLSFGYAVSAFGDVPDALTFSVYDASNALLASVGSGATLGTSSFPEAYVTASFSGRAAYATFAFGNAPANRYIIDNFSGTFGSTETGVPEPGAWALMLLGFGGVGGMIRSRRRALAIA